MTKRIGTAALMIGLVIAVCARPLPASAKSPAAKPPVATAPSGGLARRIVRGTAKLMIRTASISLGTAAYVVTKHVTGDHNLSGMAATLAGSAGLLGSVLWWGGAGSSGSGRAHGGHSEPNSLATRIDHGQVDVSYGNQSAGGLVQSLSHPGHVGIVLSPYQTMDLPGVSGTGSNPF